MSKKSKKPPVDELPPESRTAEAATVAWMLCVMTALLCELGWVAARWWAAARPDGQTAAAMAEFLFFSALVVGLVALALVPVVLRSRRVLPPRGITFFAVIVGGSPLAIALWRLLG